MDQEQWKKKQEARRQQDAEARRLIVEKNQAQSVQLSEGDVITQVIPQEIVNKQELVKVANCEKVYVRRKPSTEGEVLTIVKEGKLLSFIFEEDEWTRVTFFDKEDQIIDGFIMSRYLSRV